MDLIPENPEELFHPIEVWIDEYFCNPAEITSNGICFEYNDNVASKYLFYIVHKVINVRLEIKTERLVIYCYYKADNEDIVEKGKVFL